MVTVKQIPKGDFIDGYSKNDIWDIVNVKVGTEQRIYGKTRIDAGDKAEGYIVVYAVV